MFVRMGDRSMFRNSLLLGLALTAVSLALHFAPVWVNVLNRGAMTWDGQPLPHDLIDEIINEHRSGPEVAFTRRPLMTWSVDALTGLGVRSRTAFIALGFGLFFVAGLLVHRIARTLGGTWAQALMGQALFHLSPTILFAWFDPIYTYDEPIQYVALLTALLATVRGSAWGFVVAFSIALIAREPSLLLAPGFIVLTKPRRWWVIALPVLAWLSFLFMWMQGAWMSGASLLDLSERPGFLRFNFQDISRAGESLCYLALVLALPVFLLVRFQRSTSCSDEDRRLLRAFWISLVVNTITVLVAAKAREARLFALPLIFVWPLFGKVVQSEIERHGGWRLMLSFFERPLSAFEFVLKAIVWIFAVHFGFALSTGIPQDNLFHEYLIAAGLLILTCTMADAQDRSRLRPT